MTVRAFKPPEHGPLAATQLVRLDDDERHYLAKVRRVRVGDAVELNDLEGRWWGCVVEALSTREALLRVVEPTPPAPAVAPTALLLGLPDPKTVLELLPGVCELAVTKVRLVRCARSQTDGPGPRRVERVLRAAVRQCGRPTAPSVEGPLPLTEALALDASWPGFVAVAADRAVLAPLRVAPEATGGGLRVLVGPEGGLTPTEISEASAAGLSPVGLGPWVLRTQTAAQAMLAQILAQRPGAAT